MFFRSPRIDTVRIVEALNRILLEAPAHSQIIIIIIIIIINRFV